MTNFLIPRGITPTVTSSGAAVAGSHTPVDASGGNRTMTLPTPTHVGAYLSVEKVDASPNTVAVSGSIRGGASTVTLTTQYQSVTFVWSGTTWRPTEGHVTFNAINSAIDGKIASQAAGDAGAYETQTHAAATYATPASVTAASATLWKPSTAYVAGQAVINPAGFTVTALANFTSSSSYSAVNWSDPIAKSYVAALKPEAFGAVGDGITDDTAAVQAMFAALPGTGGSIQLTKTYLVSSGITTAKPVTITGIGGLQPGSTLYKLTSGFVCATDGIDVLTFTGEGGQRVLRDFGVKWAGTLGAATSGTGIKFANTSGGDFFVMDNVHVTGFWNNIFVQAGHYWHINDCNIYDFVNYGVYITNTEGVDKGDMSISNCVIAKKLNLTAGGTALRWESGGGLRFTNNKVNANSGFLVDGVNLNCVASGATSVFTFTGNSFEGFNGAGIRVGGQTSSSLSKITILGNEFFSQVGGQGVNVDGTGMLAVNNITIVGNVFSGYEGVSLKKCASVSLVANSGANLAGYLLNLSSVTKLSQRGNIFNSGNIIFDGDGDDLTYPSGAGYARSEWDFGTDVHAITTSKAASQVKPGRNTAVLVTVKVSVNEAVSGGAYLQQTRPLTRTSTATVTVGSAIGSDISFGAAAAAVSLSWDTAANAGFVTPTVNSVNGNALNGSIQVLVNGICSQLVP